MMINNKTLLPVFLMGLLMLTTGIVFAEEIVKPNQLDWSAMIFELLAGLALFLFGLEIMINGLLKIAGEKMKYLLSKLTVNRVMGAISGAITTAVIQSSSVTTVLVVGFVSAGLMTVAQAASVIMGANLGTTITAQIIAFKITQLAYVMIFVGFIIKFLSKTSRHKNLGNFIMGLGMLFFGMNLMGDGMAPLRNYQPFLDLMQQMQHPLYGILIGMVFTALVQSSSATIGIVIVMAGQGFLTLPAGIALSMGADIGTCITALIATIGQSREAIRTAWIHILFNVLGVLIWLPFIGFLAYLASQVSPDSAEGLSTMAAMAADVPREIANANTIFKLSTLILFLPMIPLFLWLVYKLYPITKQEKSQQKIEAQFLEEELLTVPSMAFDAVELEIERLRNKFRNFFDHILNSPNEIQSLEFESLRLNQLTDYQHQILVYLGKISQEDMDKDQKRHYVELISIINILESILDTIDGGILQVKHQAFENQIKASDTMKVLMGSLADEVGKSIDNALLSLQKEHQDKCLEVFSVKPTIDHLIHKALKHQAKYLQSDANRLMVFRLEMQVVDALKRLHTLAKRIARMQKQKQKFKTE